jgi:hypothetical protein
MALAAIPFILGGLSVASGLLDAATGKANAVASEAWGRYNASLALQFAEFNANSIEQLGAINAEFIFQSAESQAKITEALAQYNAALRVQTAEYNAQLLEKEAALVWEAQELDQVLFAREAETRLKEMRATFGSSGVDVNTGTPVDYLVDQSTQAHLEAFIIRHNADIQMGKLLDAAALGRWEGEAEAAAMIFQGQMEAASLRLEGQMQSTMTEIQAGYDAVMARFEGEIRASQIISESLWQSSQYNQSAIQSIFSGLFQGASWAARGYGNSADVGVD